MEQKNLILAVVISVAVLLSWQFLYEMPRIEAERERLAAQQAEQAAQNPAPGTTAQPGASGVAPQATAPPSAPGAPGVAGAPTAPGGGASAPVSGLPPAAQARTRDQVIAGGKRVSIDTPALRGSIALKGARIDDLILNRYNQTIEENSGNIEFLSPQGAPNAYFARFGWVAGAAGIKVPGPDTEWAASGGPLRPGSPVTLSWDNGEGLTFRQTISVDEDYLFTVDQSVTNATGQAVTVLPFGLISRKGTPETTGFWILHEGLIGVFDEILEEFDYDDIQDEGRVEKKTTGGWIGITDKYWLAALIPDQKSATTNRFIHSLQDKDDRYQVDFLADPVTVQPGQSGASSSRLFAGAKIVRILDRYEEEGGIADFHKAVDWGWFDFLTQPIFYVLEWFAGWAGNFGVAILLLTVAIKLAFFPLANKSYKAMSRLKKLQPKMMEIRENFKDDRQRQQQEMMELYKREKANPAAGCLPILVQIPVFFALYKVLFVTIEMRHAPFFGWIQDLSAPDPLGVLTGFGLVDWQVPAILAILNVGIWPIIMGGTMYLQQKLNPQPADPTQAKIFMLLPIVFTFMLGTFPAGLVIYWAWNNLLSIAQQWVIMRRMGVSASGETIPTAEEVRAREKAKAEAEAEPEPEAEPEKPANVTAPRPKRRSQRRKKR